MPKVDRDIIFTCRKRGCLKDRHTTSKTIYDYCIDHFQVKQCSVEDCTRYARDRTTGKCVQHGGKRFHRKKCIECNKEDSKRLGYCRECYKKIIKCSVDGCMKSVSIDTKDKCAFHNDDKK